MATASHWEIFPHLVRFTSRFPIAAQYSCISGDDLHLCDVSGRRRGSTSQEGARPLLEAAVRVRRLSAFH